MWPGEKLGQHLRLAAGLRSFLASPLTFDEAERQLRSRLDRRGERFLAVVRELVYGHAPSPYLPRLRAAGCELGDLEASVRTRGVEATLSALAADGVHVRLEELKASSAAFDSPRFLGRALTGATSGTTTARRRVVLDWHGLSEEAANELLLYGSHGLERAPLALYLPGLPGLAGMRNVLINAKLGRPPAIWFAPVEAGRAGDSVRSTGLAWTARLLGTRLPRPIPVPADRVERVASWLAEGRARDERRVLSAFTGPALRMAAAAADAGLDLDGNVVFATGEPLTERRRRFLASVGLRSFARYVTAESGVIAGACPEARTADDMHVWSDRIAVVEGDGGTLLFSCLSPWNGKVLLNAELGDTARIEHRRCSCLLGELGLDTRLSLVRSAKRLTAEGVSVLVTELDEIVGGLVERAGGRPDDYQIVESREDGAGRVTLFVSPELGVEDGALVAGVLDRLRAGEPSARLAGALWERAETVRVVRERPRLTPGAKLPVVVSESSP